jgi:hypothetical protein
MRRGAITISSEPTDAMEERQKGLFLGEYLQEIPEGGEDGDSGAPSIQVAGAKPRGLAQNVAWSHARRELTPHGLCDGEPKIVSHADLEPSSPVSGGVCVSEFGFDPHLFPAHFHWTGRHVIGPEIERTAARKIEPGMVPVAGENAILHASAIEGEPHMRAPVVEGANAALVHDYQDGPMRPA